MTVHLIDASCNGKAEMDVIRAFVEKGDRVLAFDSEVRDLGFVQDAEDVQALDIGGRRGRIDVARALAHAAEAARGGDVRLYSDGHFVGGYGYDAPEVRDSDPARNGRLDIVSVSADPGWVDVRTLSREHRSPVTAGEIAEVIADNLTSDTVSTAEGRLGAARHIHDLIEERMAERTAALIPEASDNAIEWTRVDGTSDVQRFDDHVALHARVDEMIATEPEAIFIASIVDGEPQSVFRRDEHPSIAALSPERQRRAKAICAARQKLHERRWGVK